jgi:hypothetical protein
MVVLISRVKLRIIIKSTDCICDCIVDPLYIYDLRGHILLRVSSNGLLCRMMDYFPGHSFFQTRCATFDGQLLYNFVNKKLSISH